MRSVLHARAYLCYASATLGLCRQQDDADGIWSLRRAQIPKRGVVLKDSATQLLIKSIHTVMSGQYWVGREAVSNLAQHLHTLLQSSGPLYPAPVGAPLGTVLWSKVSKLQN